MPPRHAADRPGLYVHVPFCSAVCPYCDFAVTVGGPRSRRLWREALLVEIELAGETAGATAAEPWAGPGASDTVYLGGGTPSALDPEDLAAVLAALGRRLGIRPERAEGDGGARVFLEANPEDVTAERLAAWRELGVAVVSLGVQSFDAAALAFLGRRHEPERSRSAVELALAAGFRTVSLDLIYGLPGQDEAAWRRELDAAVALGPDHLSCYQLTVEPATPFGRRRDRGELAELPEPAQAALFRLTHERLADAGWPAYEVSSFARAPRHRSRHNRKYWRHTPYLGLGPSAHSFDGSRRRWWNERRLAAWRARIERGERPVAGDETLGEEELALEALMLGLRTAAGIDLAGFRARHGVDLPAANCELVRRLEGEGLATVEAGRFALTLDGLALADGLAGLFVLRPGVEPLAEPA